MSLPSSIRDREQDKFTENRNGKTSVRTVSNALIQGVDYDRIDINYPTNKTEEHVYTLIGVIIQTITLEYLTNAKKDLISVVYS